MIDEGANRAERERLVERLELERLGMIGRDNEANLEAAIADLEMVIHRAEIVLREAREQRIKKGR